MSVSYIPTRDAATARLQQFLERIPMYSSQRGFVNSNLQSVSRLSPYVRRRLISEQEIAATVLNKYPFAVAEKFIQEVVWRTYWKGWLERYPGVWTTCVDYEGRLRAQESGAEWGERYQRAQKGATHLSFFNDWVHELVTTGYLHNHARMWFASVWVFTLKIPWQLGAMFMYRHLLDGDPASNTLSWRWVVGLQTKGKSYLARADNIRQFSEGRWSVAESELAQQVFPVEPDIPLDRVGSELLSCDGPLPEQKYGVLTTGDDLSVEHDNRLMAGAQSVALLQFAQEYGESRLVEDFARESEADSLQRLGQLATAALDCAEIIAWSQAQQLSHVVIVQPPVGPNFERAAEAAKALAAIGVRCSYYRREWDRQLYALTDRGFFPFWERVKKRIVARDPLFGGKSG